MKTFVENTQDTFNVIRAHICEKLTHLNEHLTYHNLDHTLDVVRQIERIAREENISDEYRIYLLKVAALYHDTGFLETYLNHEAVSCQIFLRDADMFHFTDEEISFVTRLIMATKLPQTPRDIYESIICDADLDYLGRSDFFRIGDGLRKEFLYYGIVPSMDAWEKLQIKFLTNHHYHTESCKRVREVAKQENIGQLL